MRSDDEIRADLQRAEEAQYKFSDAPLHGAAMHRLGADVGPLLDRAVAAEAARDLAQANWEQECALTGRLRNGRDGLIRQRISDLQAEYHKIAESRNAIWRRLANERDGLRVKLATAREALDAVRALADEAGRSGNSRVSAWALRQALAAAQPEPTPQPNIGPWDDEARCARRRCRHPKSWHHSPGCDEDTCFCPDFMDPSAHGESTAPASDSGENTNV